MKSNRNSEINKMISVLKLICVSILDCPRTYKIRFVVAVVFLSFSIVINVFSPILFKYTIEYYDNKLVYSSLWIIFCYALLWTSGNVFSLLREIIAYKIVERSINNVSLRIYNHLLKLSHQFHLDRKTGAIFNSIERAQSGIAKIVWGVAFFVFPLFVEFVIVSSILFYKYSYYIGFIMVFTLLTFVGFTIISSSWAAKKLRQAFDFQNYCAASAVDRLINIETIKCFNNEKYESDKYNNLLLEREKKTAFGRSAMQWMRVGQSIILGAGFTLSLLSIGYYIDQQELNVSDLVLVNGYFIQFSVPLNHLGTFIRNIREGFTSVESVIDVLNNNNIILSVPYAKDFKYNGGMIIFENISFSYDKRQILNQVSFIVYPGEVVGILGKTGSGKSTLIRLLMRFYEPTSGKIFIDGQDISSLELGSLRSIFGVIPQDIVLFNASIKENVAYGNPTASFEEIKQACSIAHIDEHIVSYPDGYDTFVGERGLKLSGGEKQRIAIARAVLKKPKVFIYDEATSALDIETEKKIITNLIEISKNMTTLIITHRPQTLKFASRVLCLDKGTLLEKPNGLDRLKVI